MRRFSIARLMGVILAVGLGMAALREASDLWAGIALSIVLVLLAGAILQVLHDQAARRAFWLGFALFGWGYLTLVSGPWFSEQLGPRLPTSILLEYIHQSVVGGQSQTNATWQSVVTLAPSGTWQPATSSGQLLVQLAATPAPPTQGNRFLRMFLAGASRHDPFIRTGHCIFTLLVALLGAALSVWIYRRAGVHDPSTASTPDSRTA